MMFTRVLTILSLSSIIVSLNCPKIIIPPTRSIGVLLKGANESEILNCILQESPRVVFHKVSQLKFKETFDVLIIVEKSPVDYVS